MQYYDFQPLQKHKYLYICDHLSMLYQTILVFKQNSNIFADHFNAQISTKCVSIPGYIHTNEQFNINFLRLSTILALCTALHSFCHVTDMCIACTFSKPGKIIIKPNPM